MRMWGVNPEFLCDQHLFTEHVNMHMIVVKIKQRIPIQNYRFDTTKIQARHDQLAEELLKRGHKHKTPLKYEDKLSQNTLNPAQDLKDLIDRCVSCRSRYFRYLASNNIPFEIDAQ
jgi:hypothetical protein